MTLSAFQSSGDAIADRRADYARQLAEGGDVAAAAELMEQALELAPHWAAGWDLLGGFCERSGQIAQAISAWRHLEALDDHGVFGARLKLAAHGAKGAGEGTAVGYVEALFDQYAPRFETALVERLGYRVPDMLDRLLQGVEAELGMSRYAHAVDLGCGTGLMGARVRGRVETLVGIDLSTAMVAETRRKGIYDQVEKAELVQFLSERPDRYDLVTAADVFIYCGALPPVLEAAASAMRAGALLAFSLEEHEGEEPVFLRPSLRYAHNADAAQRDVTAAGLRLLRFERAVLRQDRGQPINGMLFVARKG